jgi:hypothetical protein
MHEYRVKVARLLGDRAAVKTALADMREAAPASGNPSAIRLADSVQDLRARSRSSPLPPAQADDATTSRFTDSDDTAVTIFLRQEPEHARRAEHALHMLGQYANSGEAYLYCVQQGRLELAASLDRSKPPPALAVVLAEVPANDQVKHPSVTLPQDDKAYNVMRLFDAAGSCVARLGLHWLSPKRCSTTSGRR